MAKLLKVKTARVEQIAASAFAVHIHGDDGLDYVHINPFNDEQMAKRVARNAMAMGNVPRSTYKLAFKSDGDVD